jgi:hypothetical protein
MATFHSRKSIGQNLLASDVTPVQKDLPEQINRCACDFLVLTNQTSGRRLTCNWLLALEKVVWDSFDSIGNSD